MSDLPPVDETAALPSDLRFLKLLVGGLAGVMIVGLVTIVALLVIRLRVPAPVLPRLPAAIHLPQNTKAQAVTFARDYMVVVTDIGTILIYSPEGRLLKTVRIENRASFSLPSCLRAPRSGP